MRDQPPVILYTQAGCTESRQVRDLLVKHDVTFTERDATGDEYATQALYTTGTFATPLLVAGDERVFGFRPREIPTLDGVHPIAPHSSSVRQSQRRLSSSTRRIVSARAINASISASLRSASARHRAEAAVPGSKPWNSVPISAMVKPASCAIFTTASRDKTPGAYRRRPLTRCGSGSTPMLS
jgi:glutaredoxin